MGSLSYDYSFMMHDAVGSHGITKKQLHNFTKHLIASNEKFLRDMSKDYMAFQRLPDQHESIKEVVRVSKQLQKKFDALIVVGTGGSDLGARAVISALSHQHHNELTPQKRKGMKIYFAGDTTDPTPLLELLEVIDLKKTAVLVISKSGNTIETISTFMIIREKLIKKVGIKKHADHIVAITSPDSGRLIELVTKEGYTFLAHGPVGGRFSVTSNVGLLPIACAGIDIKQFVFGADSLRYLVGESRLSKNPAFIYATLHYLGYTKKQKNISVLMPYDYKLKEVGTWYRQLWAESLGKKKKGQTPIAALGPTDQHSQLQLYQQGPNDKQITFITSEKKKDIKTPKVAIKGIGYFGNKKLSSILSAELESTRASLMKDKRPSGTIMLPELNAYYLGQLVYFFELATAYSGELYNVNAFNQPGIEQSKKFLHAKLGNKELLDMKKELEKLQKKSGKYIA